MSPGSRWGGELPVAPRLMTILGAQGRVVRPRNTGHWRVSRPTWAPMDRWLGGRWCPCRPGPGTPCWSAAGSRRSVRGRSRTSGGGSAARSPPSVPRSGRSLRSRSPSEMDRPRWVLPTTSTRLPSSRRGRRCSRCWNRPSWDGSSAASTWARTARCSSTAPATRRPRHRLVGRAHRRRLGAGRHRRRPAPAARGRRRRGPRRPRGGRRRRTDWLGGVRIGTVYPSPLMRGGG